MKVQWAMSQALCASLAACVQPAIAQSLTSLEELRFYADIDIAMPGDGSDIYGDDASVIVFDPVTGLAFNANSIGELDQAGVDAHHRHGDGCGNSIFSLDTTTLYEGVGMRPADVFDGAGVKILDAVAAGIPAGINVDAVSREPGSCDLLLSIDSTTMLSGQAFRPDDVIRWNSNDGFSLYAATGFNVNIDALHLIRPNRMLISTDIGSSLPDINSVDEQILEIIPSGNGAFQLLAFDPGTLSSSWQGADLTALWVRAAPIAPLIFKDGFE